MAGDVVALWRLTRPPGSLFVSLVPLIGYGLAHWDRALNAVNAWAIVPLVVSWWLLNAGTLWLNAALDKDEGEVLFGQATPVPAVASSCGFAALFGCVAVAACISWSVGLCAFACAVLAVFYSHPTHQWKGHRILGPVVNVLGYGFFSPLAGWLVVDVPLTLRGIATLGILMWWTLGWYFAAQAFQGEEDAARGYRTLVVECGPQVAVRAGWACLAVAVGGFVFLSIIGWYPRIILGALPAFFGGHLVFAAWAREPDGGSAAWAMRVVRWTMAAGLVMLFLAYSEYVSASFQGGPVAGLATAHGHPSDRPPLPPSRHVD